MAMDRHLALALTAEHKLVLVISKTVSGTLSALASSIIIYKIYLRCTTKSSGVNGSLRSSYNDGAMTTYYRILLSISILDVVHSLGQALSIVAVPSYTNGRFARGTTATCTVAGILLQMTAPIVIYMTMLNTYFMMKIRYNVPDAIITSRYEFWFHAIPLVHLLSTTIIGLSMRIYGPIILTELGCWLDSYCVFTNTCTRSGPIFYNYLDYYAWSFAYIWLFICTLVVAINAVLIYTAIRKQEKRNENYLAARLQKSGSISLFNSGAIDLADSNVIIENFKDDTDPTDIQRNDFTSKDESDPSDIQQSDFTSTELFVKRDDLEAKSKLDSVETEKSIFKSGHFPADLIGEAEHVDVTESDRLPNARPSITTRQSQRTKTTQKIKKSRVAAVQSMLYVSSALFTAVWIFMPWLGRKLGLDTPWRFFFALMLNIFGPSQGMFNLFIFVRLHYLKLRETHTDWSRMKCVRQCLFSAD